MIAAEPVHILHTTNEIRAIIHDEVCNALGQKKLIDTYREAATAVGLSVEMLRKAVRGGELEARFAGTKPVFTPEEITRWLHTLPTESTRA